MTNCGCSSLSSLSSDLVAGNYIRSADGILMPIWFKDPDDVRDYGLGWGLHLTEDDEIVASVFTPSNAALQVLSSNFDATRTFVWLTGGVTTVTYFVKNHITTEDGREFDRTFAIQVGHN